MADQPQDLRTLYAELLELVTALEASRSIGHLKGSFTTKRVAERDYVYFQYTDPGGRARQLYLAPDGPAIRQTMERWRSGRAELAADADQIERLCTMLRAGGAMTVPKGVARVLVGLADAGVFRLGGVLVGTHAFVVLGNLLGVKWEGAVWKTEDVDVAAAQRLAVAVSADEADVPAALESLEMGFVPVPRFDPREPSTSYKVRGKPLRVDSLTPGRRGVTKPVKIPRFKTTAEPLRFLDFVLDASVPAVATDGRRAVLVNVPSPARFALHKLMVTQLRPPHFQTKAQKDLNQAALVLEVLGEDRPTDVEVAVAALRSRKDGALGKLKKIVGRLRKRNEAAARVLTRAMG